jgi:RNA polymerase sigma factor for flagellar operon FliA
VTAEARMGVFSGPYPKDLTKVIEHAKRMTDVLNEMERVRTDAWFRGRAGELRGVVSLALGDWRRGTSDAEAAGKAILSYVDALHRGASKRLRCGLALACCEVDDVITAVASDDGWSVVGTDGETTGASRPSHGPTVPAGWVDRPEMLARFREGLELVEIHARTLARSVSPGCATTDDLRAFGREGLLDAARSFTEHRGVPFERWASIRIRNAMIDGVRSWGAIPSRARRRLRGLAAVGSEESRIHRQAGSPVPEASEFEESSDGSPHMASPTDVPITIGDRLEALPVTPEDVLVKAQLESTVRTLVASLPKRERALIERIYFQGQGLEQAAASLGVTRSWARRVRDRAIDTMKSELRKHDEMDSGGARCGPKRS